MEQAARIPSSSTTRHTLATYAPVRLTDGGACEKARTWNPALIEGMANVLGAWIVYWAFWCGPRVPGPWS